MLLEEKQDKNILKLTQPPSNVICKSAIPVACFRSRLSFCIKSSGQVVCLREVRQDLGAGVTDNMDILPLGSVFERVGNVRRSGGLSSLDAERQKQAVLHADRTCTCSIFLRYGFKMVNADDFLQWCLGRSARHSWRPIWWPPAGENTEVAVEAEAGGGQEEAQIRQVTALALGSVLSTWLVSGQGSDFAT